MSRPRLWRARWCTSGWGEYSYPRGEFFQYDSVDDFPVTGQFGVLYLVEGTGTLYVWNRDDYVVIAAPS